MQLVELQRALQSHVIDGDATIADAIDSSAEISADTRLKIYFDAYRLRLIEALEANFPVLANFLGDEEFSKLTQLYLAVHPSRHYSIRWFGHHLAEFLAEYPDYREQPWLVELAEWEWAIAAGFDAGDAHPIVVDDLAVVAPDEWPTLHFIFHPSVKRATVNTNIVAIVKASAADQKLPTPKRSNAPSEWLVWRRNLTVQYRSLETDEAAALDTALRGEHFGAICETIAEHRDPDTAPLRAASLLKQWITEECVIELRRS
ncbi:MAG TPA: DNA-binding domain-containing protein [Steroidobacteraceae bacterium]|nr:DNA-binding domain-containing protein [Steroidobacteraceae bacterium]